MILVLAADLLVQPFHLRLVAGARNSAARLDGAVLCNPLLQSRSIDHKVPVFRCFQARQVYVH